MFGCLLSLTADSYIIRFTVFPAFVKFKVQMLIANKVLYQFCDTTARSRAFASQNKDSAV